MDAEEMNPAHSKNRRVKRLHPDLGLGGDELEAAGQLLAEQAAGSRAIRMPPGCRLANLPLRIAGDLQPKAQCLVRKIFEKLPAVDDLAAVGLMDRLKEQRLIFR